MENDGRGIRGARHRKLLILSGDMGETEWGE